MYSWVRKADPALTHMLVRTAIVMQELDAMIKNGEFPGKSFDVEARKMEQRASSAKL